MRHFGRLTPLIVLAACGGTAREPLMHFADSGVRTSMVELASARRMAAGSPDLLGCYRLTLGPWSSGTGLGPPPPTEVFRLDSATVRGGPHGARATVRLLPAIVMPPTDPRASWLRPPWWRMIGADSLEIITWTTATEGEVFYGHIAGAQLRGVLRRTSDAMQRDPKTKRIIWGAWPWARATARRVSCP
jgi:hypothetical protein